MITHKTIWIGHGIALFAIVAALLLIRAAVDTHVGAVLYVASLAVAPWVIGAVVLSALCLTAWLLIRE